MQFLNKKANNPQLSADFEEEWQNISVK